MEPTREPLSSRRSNHHAHYDHERKSARVLRAMEGGGQRGGGGKYSEGKNGVVVARARATRRGEIHNDVREASRGRGKESRPAASREQDGAVKGHEEGPGEKRPLSHRSRESRASSRRPVRLGASRLRVVGAPSNKAPLANTTVVHQRVHQRKPQRRTDGRAQRVPRSACRARLASPCLSLSLRPATLSSRPGPAASTVVVCQPFHLRVYSSRLV